MAELINANSLFGFAELVTELGFDMAIINERFALPEHHSLTDTPTFINFNQLVSSLEFAATYCNCPDFSLKLAKKQGLNVLGAIAITARNADSIGDALHDICHYIDCFSPAIQLTPLSTENRFLIQMNETAQKRPLTGQFAQLTLGNAVHILRLLAGAQVNPKRIYFNDSETHSGQMYQDYFQCEVLHMQHMCAIELDLTLLTTPIVSADPFTHQLVSRYLNDLQLSSLQSLVPHVRALIEQLIATGGCTIQAVAAHLAIGPRTLQRRLAKQDTRFESIVDEVRKHRAQSLFANPALTLSQITALLGYAEQSSLQRSTKRWFGVSCNQIRKRYY